MKLRSCLLLQLTLIFATTRAFKYVAIDSATQLYDWDHSAETFVTVDTSKEHLYVTLQIQHEDDTPDPRFQVYAEFLDLQPPEPDYIFVVMFKPARQSKADAVVVEWWNNTFAVYDFYQSSGNFDFQFDAKQNWTLRGNDTLTCDSYLCYAEIFADRKLATRDMEDYPINCNLEYRVGVSSKLQVFRWTAWIDPILTCNTHLSNAYMVSNPIYFELFNATSAF